MIVLELEAIGLRMKTSIANRTTNIRTDKKPPWVAKIIDFDTFGNFTFEREFLKPMVDYSRSNSVGSRDIYYYYHLYENNMYEIFEHSSWKHTSRYFAIIQGHNLIKKEKKDAILWISNI